MPARRLAFESTPSSPRRKHRLYFDPLALGSSQAAPTIEPGESTASAARFAFASVDRLQSGRHSHRCEPWKRTPRYLPPATAVAVAVANAGQGARIHALPRQTLPD